ncbi:Uncharacterized protein Fot_37510 [Forsythia ovata]|uniref:Uncharacterized protein n=1 Tax=Forsythia ovata TaxID=205694 RepID=A0ABD1RZS5_9LAMI
MTFTIPLPNATASLSPVIDPLRRPIRSTTDTPRADNDYVCTEDNVVRDDETFASNASSHLGVVNWNGARISVAGGRTVVWSDFNHECWGNVVKSGGRQGEREDGGFDRIGRRRGSITGDRDAVALGRGLGHTGERESVE